MGRQDPEAARNVLSPEACRKRLRERLTVAGIGDRPEWDYKKAPWLKEDLMTARGKALEASGQDGGPGRAGLSPEAWSFIKMIATVAAGTVAYALIVRWTVP